MGLLVKLFKALNSDSSPWQLAFGFTLGMIMGLTPILGLHSLILLFSVLFFRVNLSSFLVAWALFSIFTLPLDAFMSSIGESLLTAESLTPMWTAFYSNTVGQLTQFYHTLTLGSLIVALLLSPFILLISQFLVVKYREKVMVWVNKIKLVQFIKGSNFYRLYQGLGE
ncbi:TIGR03546 family protein [Flavobacterium sp. W21_SRS_FM6]|uniref:TIGR03546 family protein n=1 Tax=Flavobacterium sp. W21_SRS_FM6 TaxID=3240268 RepID=UPI003F8F7D89